MTDKTQPVTMVKCFNTAVMPDEVAAEICDGQDGDDCWEHWVTDDIKEYSPVTYQWFIDNGAVHDEKVLIARGDW